MAAKIQKQIIDFFTFFEEFNNSCKTCLKDCQNCALTINKLIIRCRKIKEADVIVTPLNVFEDLQEKILSLLHHLISYEINEVRNNLSKVEELFEKLCNKHRCLQESCKDIDWQEQSLLVKGTPLQPPLQQLLKFAEQSLTFGSEVSAQIATSLNILTYKGLDTESLIDNFKISSSWQQKIPEIIAYTSFCSENQI